MWTHPLWRPLDKPDPETLRQATVPGQTTTTKPGVIEVVAPDPRWPQLFDELATLIHGALGDRVVELHHVGSTSVPGLHAKPVIDIDLLVADSADEAAYLPDLEQAGFRLVIREPDWEEHRCLLHDSPRCNLHVFSAGAVEPQRHLVFRDWLRAHDDDRDAYADHKRGVATRGFTHVSDYNAEKSQLIYEIYERIFAADVAHEHTPRPVEQA